MKNLTHAKRLLLAVLSISFVALFSVGCGDSAQTTGFTAAGGADAQANQGGNLVFRFARVAPQFNAPNASSTIRIDLYDALTALPANLRLSQSFAFAETVTMSNVDTNVVFAVISLFDANSVLLTRFTVSFELLPGSTTEVDASTATLVNVTFDALAVQPNPINLTYGVLGTNTTATVQSSLIGTLLGENFFLPINNTSATFNIGSTRVANVSASGAFTATAGSGTDLGGNTTATVTYSLNGLNQTATVNIFTRVFTVTPIASTTVSQGGTYNGGFLIGFVDANTVPVAIAANTTFSLESAVEGVTVSSAGVVTTTAATPTGTFNVVATWVDGRTGGTGLTFTTTIPFTIVP